MRGERVCPTHDFTPMATRPIPPPTWSECNVEDIHRLVPRTPVIEPSVRLMVDGEGW